MAAGAAGGRTRKSGPSRLMFFMVVVVMTVSVTFILRQQADHVRLSSYLASNTTIFDSVAVMVNEAGGRAYRLESRHALAQYAATGCLNSTFYASDRDQLEKILALCDEVDPLFIAKT